jgi:hypothetical protein
MAKKFDIDGNGVLDHQEQKVGKQIIAEQFFNDHPKGVDLHLFGDEYLARSLEENVKELSGASNYAFKKRVQELKNIERDLATKSSKHMKEALTVWNPDLIKNNYFTNKFDSTAWNDFGAPGPRDPMFHLQTDHHGSLDTLKNLRKNKDRHYCQEQLDKAKARELAAQPWMTNSFQGSRGGSGGGKGMFGGSPPKATAVTRSAYITNPRIENTVRL